MRFVEELCRDQISIRLVVFALGLFATVKTVDTVVLYLTVANTEFCTRYVCCKAPDVRHKTHKL